HYMARKQKEPAFIFMVTGIIPLVPGGLAYDATKNLVLLNFSTAINTMLEVTLIEGAIALGLLFADQISKLIVSGFVKSFKRL
ncbi:threonine/serine exporter family protein, partial [Staphylococcus aureus]